MRGQVFHLTTKDAFCAILRDAAIGHNRGARYPLNHGSAGSFGRLQGYVCLYDLRGASPQRLALTRKLCDFLYPAWLAEGRGQNLVYLHLRPEAFPRLVPNATAFHLGRLTGRIWKYLPGAECWYPGDLPLSEVGEVLHVIG